jgi:hypothetical protein
MSISDGKSKPAVILATQEGTHSSKRLGKGRCVGSAPTYEVHAG